MMLYVYETDETRFYTKLIDAMSGMESKDKLNYTYNEELNRYEIYYSFKARGKPDILALQSKTTGLMRGYTYYDLGLLDIVDIGEINEKEFFESMHPEMYRQLYEFYNGYLTMARLQLYSIDLFAAGDGTGVSQLIIKAFDGETETERTAVEMTFSDEDPSPYRTISDLYTLVKFAKGGESFVINSATKATRRVVNIEYGAMPFDIEDCPDIGNYAVINIKNCSEILDRDKAISSALSKMGITTGSCFLRYFSTAYEDGFMICYNKVLDYNGYTYTVEKDTGLRLDFDLNLAETNK